MHTGLAAGWSAVMLLYELVIFDTTDPVDNPMWRQGSYLIPFVSRIGVICSLYNWSNGIELKINLYWTYETMNAAHISLSGFSILASCWHWAYWDLNLFISQTTGKSLLDLNKILGIHLFLASSLCFGFGYGHLSGFLGPGMWTSDSFGLLGTSRLVKPIFSVIGLGPFCYGLISGHHIVAGLFGIIAALWHISSYPAPLLYKLLKMSNIESVLSSSIASVFFAAFMNSALMWYASASAAIELFGPLRYHWDNGYFSQDIEGRVKSSETSFVKSSETTITTIGKAWQQVPDKLVLYDYIGCNPSKGGLFRSGPIIKGDGIVQNWLGHPSFEIGTLSLAVRRMPAFFETFPVILIDQGGSLRADIPFRRAESSYSIEETQIILYFTGGIFNGTEYSTPSLVKDYARKAQFGEILTFDKKTSGADGVFRTSPRGWYSFSHIAFALFFLFGHLWHASRAVFQDIWTGVTIESLEQVEYGRNEKLGSNIETGIRGKTSAFV